MKDGKCLRVAQEDASRICCDGIARCRRRARDSEVRTVRSLWSSMDAANVRRADPISIGYLRRRPFQELLREQHAENASTAADQTDKPTNGAPRSSFARVGHSSSWKEHRLRSSMRCDDKQEQSCPDCCCCSVTG